MRSVPVLLIVAWLGLSPAQTSPMLTTGTALPATCVVGASYVLIGAGAGFYICTALNTWTALAPAVGGGGSLPSGAMVLIESGACPAGTTESTTMNGVTVIGTLTANGNVGTTGGADSLTPAGTNTGGGVSAHTGTAVADHPSHTHTSASAPATPDLFTSLTTTAGVGMLTGGPSATLTHSVTQPAAHSVTQPTFTGVAFDNRSAFRRVIFCKAS